MRYAAPTTTREAVALLSGEAGCAHVLAGGTDLLVQIRTERLAPDLVVDVKRIAPMTEITPEDGGFRIGAAVSAAKMGRNEALRRAWPGVVEAAELIGSTQIQSRATMACNQCNASPAADCVPALMAGDARIRVAGPDGTRDAAVGEIAIGPGKTSLARGELVESVFLPARPARSADAYQRFIPRTEMDIAVVGAGVSLTLDDAGAVGSAHLALGAVAERVLLVAEAADAIVGTHLDDGALDRLGQAASAAARPIDDKRGTVQFRKHVAGVLARRAAVEAFRRAGAAK